jgi:hypothetical protein
MMNSGGLKAIAIAMVTIGCLVAITLGADTLSVLAIGFVGVGAIEVL